MANPVSLRSFVQISQAMSQQPNTVAVLGELSQLSLTYSKNLSNAFPSTSLTGYELYVFDCTDTVTSQQVTISQAIADLVLNITAQCVSYSSGHALPFNGQDLIDTLTAASVNQGSNFQIGSFITQSGFATLPEWFSFVYSDGSTIKVWLSDQSFQSEYDLFSIVVVPPMTPLDNFFQTVGVVQSDLNAISQAQYINTIQQARGIYPETDIASYMFNYYSPIVGNQPIPTVWSALVYGQAGNNLDSIKVAFQNYIAANTTHQVSDWQQIFPDIYKQTEFVIVPRWDIYAIPQATTIQGLYRNMTNPATDTSLALTFTPFYTPSFTSQNLTIFSHYYKYISLVAVNGQNNVSSQATLEGIFPDYIPQSSNSLDYNRMTQNTQQWSDLLLSMLQTAETMTAFSLLPQGMRRIYRNNIMYLQATFNNVDYLMVPKQSFSILAPTTNGGVSPVSTNPSQSGASGGTITG